MDNQELWQDHNKNITFLISAAVGFPVGIYVGRAENGVEYQIMPDNEERAGEFWEWHVNENEQWFPDPIAAGADFASKYYEFIKKNN